MKFGAVALGYVGEEQGIDSGRQTEVFCYRGIQQ